jgi:hypothetical protein
VANNVLEAIYLSIKADTKELRTSLVEVSKRLGEVEKNAKTASLKVAETKPASDIAGGAIGELTGKIKQLALAYFSLRGAAQMVNNYLSSALNLGFTSQKLNEDVETVNAFGEAVARNGGSVQGFSQSLSNLTDKMRKARLEGDAGIYTPLARLGVGGFGADTTGTDMMLRIAERMKGMTSDAAFTFGQELGFDDATIRTLQQGRGEVEKLITKYKELGVYSQKDFEAAKKLKNAMQDLRQSFTYLQTQTMRLLAPAITFLTEKLTAITKWMRDNEQFVRVFFISLAAVITAVAIPAILRMAAAWIVAFAPLLIIGGIIALLIDDFLVWRKGGEAALGALWGKLVPLVEKFREFWTNTKDIRAEFAKLAKSLGRVISAILQFSAEGWLAGMLKFIDFLDRTITKLDEIIDRYDVLGWLKETKENINKKGVGYTVLDNLENAGIAMWSLVFPNFAAKLADDKVERMSVNNSSSSTTTNNDNKIMTINIYNAPFEAINALRSALGVGGVQ